MTGPTISALPSEEAVLALSLGHRLGWAALSTAGTITSGRMSVVAASDERPGLRFLRLRAWLTQAKAAAGGLRAVVFDEATGPQALAEAHAYGGLVATVTAWCEHHRIAYEAASVGAWKWSLTGQAHASTADLIATLRGIGYAPATAEEAKALGMLLWQVSR